MFNIIINTLIRDLPMSTRSAIAIGLFLVCLLAFKKSFRIKNEMRPIKAGWFIVFVLALAMSVLYVTL